MNQDRYFRRRLEMVATQISSRGIRDKGVLSAMREVPRHLFVPESSQGCAYEDAPLSIGYGQTISQPYIVAFMSEALQVTMHDKVLEVGTGSGYQAAVLSKIGNRVYTIEIVRALVAFAKKWFQQLEYGNISIKLGNGYWGWEEAAPFDAIMVTAAADHIIVALLRQLKIGGHIRDGSNTNSLTWY